MSSKLVLVLNCGSSSLKFAIIDAVNGEEYLSGLAECFHLPEARIKWKMDGNKQEAALGAGAVTTDAVLFVQVVRQGVEIRLFRHSLVECGVKYSNVFVFQL
ncbi:acetate kinase, partial [Escherichia coli]